MESVTEAITEAMHRIGIEVSFPTHSYVPGQNVRHPEGAFDHIRASIQSDMPAGDISRSSAFLHGLIYLDSGYFWEAHEVLEPVWMVLPRDSEERVFVQGLIQLANGYLKLNMGRLKASARLACIAADLMNQVTANTVLDVEREGYLKKIQELRDHHHD